LRSDSGQVLEWIEVIEGLDVDTPVISRGMELIQDGALVIVAAPMGATVAIEEATEEATEEVVTDEQ
jgi:hypothetical protein